MLSLNILKYLIEPLFPNLLLNHALSVLNSRFKEYFQVHKQEFVAR